MCIEVEKNVKEKKKPLSKKKRSDETRLSVRERVIQ